MKNTSAPWMCRWGLALCAAVVLCGWETVAAQSRAEQEEELEFEAERKQTPPEKRPQPTRRPRTAQETNPYTIEARGAGDFILNENKELGHAGIQLTSSSLTYRIKLAKRGVTVVEFPADDAIYAIHPGNSNYIILDGVGDAQTPRRPSDPLVFRPGEGYGQKGLLTTTMYTIQFVSGLVVSLIFDPVDNLKDNTNRVILSYNVRDVVLNRRQLGLETNLVNKKRPPMLAGANTGTAGGGAERSANGRAAQTTMLNPAATTRTARAAAAAAPPPAAAAPAVPEPTPAAGPPPTPAVPEPTRSKLGEVLAALRSKKDEYKWLKSLERRTANNGFILFVAAKKPENNHILYGFAVRRVEPGPAPINAFEVIAERVSETSGVQRVLSVHKPDYILWDEKEIDGLYFAAVQMPINEIKQGEWFRFRVVEKAKP